MNTILEKLNIKEDNYGACSGPDGWIKSSSSKKISSINPSTGEIIASVYESTIDDCNKIIKKSGSKHTHVAITNLFNNFFFRHVM